MSEHLSNIVVVGVIHREGKVFIARRADTKTTFPGRYELIGGHVDPGEQLVVALQREIHEELAVEVEVGQIIDAFTYESENMFKVEICYLCTLTDATKEPTLHPADHSEAKWIGAGELALFEKEDEETEIVRKAFKLIGGTYS
jgi:8-oxo-dGTP pyrophosphatase MutT (NUDIX family)